MSPLVVSVISISPAVVNEAAERLPEGSPVILPLAREKEPSPLKVCSFSAPMETRLKFPAASMVKGVPRTAKVQVPSSAMWMLALVSELATPPADTGLLEMTSVTAPELKFVIRSLASVPMTSSFWLRRPGTKSQGVVLTMQFVETYGIWEMRLVMLMVPLVAGTVIRKGRREGMDGRATV